MVEYRMKATIAYLDNLGVLTCTNILRSLCLLCMRQSGLLPTFSFMVTGTVTCRN